MIFILSPKNVPRPAGLFLVIIKTALSILECFYIVCKITCTYKLWRVMYKAHVVLSLSDTCNGKVYEPHVQLNYLSGWMFIADIWLSSIDNINDKVFII